MRISEIDEEEFISQKEKFSPKWSFGHLECSFDNCVEWNPKLRLKIFFQWSRLTEIASFSKSKTFPQIVRLVSYNSVLTTPVKNSLESWKNSTQFWKWLGRRFCRRELFLKKFVWPRRRQFWRAAPEKKLIRAKNFQWKSKWGEENQSLSQKSLFQFVLTDKGNAILINSPVNFS